MTDQSEVAISGGKITSFCHKSTTRAAITTPTTPLESPHCQLQEYRFISPGNNFRILIFQLKASRTRFPRTLIIKITLTPVAFEIERYPPSCQIRKESSPPRRIRYTATRPRNHLTRVYGINCHHYHYQLTSSCRQSKLCETTTD